MYRKRRTFTVDFVTKKKSAVRSAYSFAPTYTFGGCCSFSDLQTASHPYNGLRLVKGGLERNVHNAYFVLIQQSEIGNFNH